MTRPRSNARGPVATVPWNRAQLRNSSMTRTLTTLLALPAGLDPDAEGSDFDGDELAKGLDLSGHSVGQAVELVEGELVQEGGASITDLFQNATVDAIFDAFLSADGRLVPARTADLEPLNATESRTKAYARARELDEIRARAWSHSTLRNYGRAVRGWRAWCAQEQISSLPLDPLQVANHLLDYAFAWDDETGDYLRDEYGDLVGRVSAGSVSLRLAGLNKAAEFIGFPRPGDNSGVVEVMRGIRRALGVDPTLRKAALDYSLLTSCLHAATGATYSGVRDRALILAKARADVTAGQLSNLAWDDVTFEENALVLRLKVRGSTTCEVRVPVHRNPSLCLSRCLEDLKALAGLTTATPNELRGRPVFAHRDGRSLSRQAPYLRLQKLSASVGGWQALPGLADRVLAQLVSVELSRLPLATARDRALLLVGFFTASRRSNLAGLLWRDVTDYGSDGWKVVHRKSKTDQEGRGHTIWLPNTDEEDCPSQALRSWRRQVEIALGRPPEKDEPVFAAMHAHGALHLTERQRLRRLSGAAINEAVQRLCVAAGLAGDGERNPFGAHSLRVGFVTEGLKDDKLSIAEVQSVTNHSSVDVLIGYHRQVNAAKTNPSLKLVAKLGKGSS